MGTVNASRADFEAGVRDLAMMHAPDRVRGQDRYAEAFDLLGRRSGTIKVVVEVATPPGLTEPAGMMEEART